MSSPVSSFGQSFSYKGLNFKSPDDAIIFFMDPTRPERAKAILRKGYNYATPAFELFIYPLWKHQPSAVFPPTTYDAALTICALNGLPVSDLDILLLRPEAFVIT